MSQETEEITVAVGEIVIAKALDLVRLKADEYTPIQYSNVIMEGMHPDKLQEHAGCQEFCDKCIPEAVARERHKYFQQRTEFMGKMYEFSTKGYVTDIEYVEKDDKIVGSRLVRLKGPVGDTNEVVIKKMKKQLKKQFSILKIFTSRSYDVNGSETDNFKYCDGCGEMFAYTPILNDQEIDHWDEMTTESLKESVQSPQDAYTLRSIFEHSIYDEELQERIWKIASRLITP